MSSSPAHARRLDHRQPRVVLHDEPGHAGGLLLAVLGEDVQVLLVRVVDEVDPAAGVVVRAGLGAVLLEVAGARAQEQRDAVVGGGEHEAVVAALEAHRAVAAARAAQVDVAVARRRVDAGLQLGAQLVGVVVQRAVDEVDLEAAAVALEHGLDLVAEHLAADDPGRSHADMVTGPSRSCRSPAHVYGVRRPAIALSLALRRHTRARPPEPAAHGPRPRGGPP